MNGQWIGTYHGTTQGTVIVNVDELRSRFKGSAYLHQQNTDLPKTVAWFETANKDKRFTFRTDKLAPVDPVSGLISSWDALKDRYPPNIAFSKYADVTGEWTNDSLALSWTTEIGTMGKCVLPRSEADKPSEITPLQ